MERKAVCFEVGASAPVAHSEGLSSWEAIFFGDWCGGLGVCGFLVSVVRGGIWGNMVEYLQSGGRASREMGGGGFVWLSCAD